MVPNDSSYKLTMLLASSLVRGSGIGGSATRTDSHATGCMLHVYAPASRAEVPAMSPADAMRRPLGAGTAAACVRNARTDGRTLRRVCGAALRAMHRIAAVGPAARRVRGKSKDMVMVEDVARV